LFLGSRRGDAKRKQAAKKRGNTANKKEVLGRKIG